VESGEKIIEELEKGDEYDVIVIDQHMGGMSGPETAKMIRKSNKDYSSIPTIRINEAITIEFNSQTLYDIGPCPFPLNFQAQYMPSVWIEIDLTNKKEDKYFILKAKTNVSSFMEISISIIHSLWTVGTR